MHKIRVRESVDCMQILFLFFLARACEWFPCVCYPREGEWGLSISHFGVFS